MGFIPLLSLAVVAACVAWRLIPGKGRLDATNPPESPGSVTVGAWPVSPIGPGAAAIHEKLQILQEQAMIKHKQKQANEVVAELNELFPNE